MGLSGVFSSKHREQNYPEATQRKITIAIINQRFSIGINEDLLNLYSKSGNQKSEIPYTPCPGSWEGLDGINFLANPQKHFVPTHKHPNQPKRFSGSSESIAWNLA